MVHKGSWVRVHCQWMFYNEHYIQSWTWLICDLENLNRFNWQINGNNTLTLCNKTWCLAQIQGRVNAETLSVIHSALVLEIIHPSNCMWIWKSATVYFQLMTKRWTAVIWCIVMHCPPGLYKSIYCSVNLFNRWKSKKKSILKQIQISECLHTAHIYMPHC